MVDIYRTADLRPYFKIADDKLKESPCVRRQYAALIAYSDPEMILPLWVVETNNRQSRCCDGECIRSAYGVRNGERIEMGAEVHAETAALISAPTKGEVFILAGQTSQGTPLYGKDVYPCHGCALAIKFAGYKHIYIRSDKSTITAVSIADIIEERESEWEPDN